MHKNFAIPKQIIYPINYLDSLLRSGSFEGESRTINELKNYLNSPYPPIFLGRARSGIYLLVKYAVERKKVFNVLLSPYTIPDVINLVRLAGGNPIFIDSMPNSTNIDLNLLESNIDLNTACVLVTHYHLSQNEIQKIKLLCKEKSIYLFEDCAIALGSFIDNKHVGLHGDAGVLSLSGYKALNFFWGGAILTKSEEINLWILHKISKWERLPKINYLNQVYRVAKYDFLTSQVMFKFFTQPIIKFAQKKSKKSVQLNNPRLETKEIDCTILSKPNLSAFLEWESKICNLDKNIQHRRKIAQIYNKQLSQIMISNETSTNIYNSSVFINYPIKVNISRRAGLYKKLIENNFNVGLSLYPNCANYPQFRLTSNKCNNTSNLESSVLTLPTHPFVTEDYAQSLATYLEEIHDI
jgi:perosamine synthetase